MTYVARDIPKDQATYAVCRWGCGARQKLQEDRSWDPPVMVHEEDCDGNR